GRCGDQELALAEVDQRAVGCGIGVAQPLEDNAWRVGAGIGEELADDDLEQIAASKGGPGALDQCRIFAWAVIALVEWDCGREVEAVGIGPGVARQSLRRSAANLELIAVERCRLSHVIDDKDLVGKIEDEIALIAG